MPKIGYNISKIESILSKMNISPTSQDCKKLKDCLNEFFTEAECVEVLYTENKDRLFFGMSTMPVINNDDVRKILLTDKDMRIDKYGLEIDSKLFELGLNDRELTAILLHEVGHLVTNDIPIKEVRKKIDMYLAKNREEMNADKTIKNSTVLGYGIKDAIRKLGSVFHKDDKEVIADSFVALCGYGEDLESALDKLSSSKKSLVMGVKEPKLLQWDWCFRVYKDIEVKRIGAIHTLNRGKTLSSSTLEKKEMDKVIKFLREDTSILVEMSEEALNEAKGKLGFINSLKYGNIRVLEDDLFELTIRSKSASDEDSALQILRQINMRMSILRDYISIPELPESDRMYWTDVYQKYMDLRESLSKKKVWNRKNYGLFFDYNALDKGEDPYHGMEY